MAPVIDEEDDIDVVTVKFAELLLLTVVLQMLLVLEVLLLSCEIPLEWFVSPGLGTGELVVEVGEFD